jgi:hypothetical protein
MGESSYHCSESHLSWRNTRHAMVLSSAMVGLISMTWYAPGRLVENKNTRFAMFIPRFVLSGDVVRSEMLVVHRTVSQVVQLSAREEEF